MRAGRRDSATGGELQSRKKSRREDYPFPKALNAHEAHEHKGDFKEP
jgi:hypothetical protein